MAKDYRPVDRDQQFLLPPSMAEWLPADHLCWFVAGVVEQLDTSGFHRGRRVGGAGRAGFDPDMLLTLLVYAYCVGVRSSRQVERLCQTDVAFRVLCADDRPDHTTVARFRAEHEGEFASLFSQVLVLCARAGMGRVGLVAVDGTKIPGNASIGANRGEEALRAEAERILGEAAAVDAAEDAEFGERRGDELPPELVDPASRAARIRRCLEEIDADRAQAEQLDAQTRAAAAEYLADVDAGRSPGGVPRRGVDRVDAAQRRLAHAEAAQQAKIDCWREQKARDRSYPGAPPTPVDEHSRVRRCRQALEKAQAQAAAAADTAARPARAARRYNVTDPDSRLMPTRRGWVQGFNAQLVVSDDHLILATALTQQPCDVEQYTPMVAAAVTAAAHLAEQTGRDDLSIGTVLADAGYASGDNLTAAGPDRLIALGKGAKQTAKARRQPAHDPPPEDAAARELMDHRLRTPAGISTYKRRGATVEPTIGHLKQILDRFSRRGLTAAASELSLAASVTNLLKLHRLQAAG